MTLDQIFLILGYILLSIVLGSLNALFSYFLDFCFWEHNIFGKYLPWLAKINLKTFDKKKYNELKLVKNNSEYENMLIDGAMNMPFFKVLGGCIICFSVWTGLFNFILIYNLIEIPFFYFIPFSLFSSFILRKINK